MFKTTKYNIPFKWKVLIVPVALEPLPKCEKCGGTGERAGGFNFFDPHYPVQCDACLGRGHLNDLPNTAPIELQTLMQELLDKHLNEK